MSEQALIPVDRPERQRLLLELLDQGPEASGVSPLAAALVRDAIADNDALRRQILALRDVISKLSPVVEALWSAVVTQVVPVFRALEPYLNEGAPMGAEWDGLGRTECTPANTQPRPVRGVCARCEGAIHWIDSPYGGWWAHEEHPADQHDADLRVAHGEAELP